MEGKTIQERIADVIAKTCTDYVDAYRMDEKTAQILTRVLAAEFGMKHVYDPATHVVVSRGAARVAVDEWFVRYSRNALIGCDDERALAELRAALEGEHE